MNKSLPCINCISFPICLSTYYKHIHLGKLYSVVIVLGNRCSTLTDYIYGANFLYKEGKLPYKNNSRINKVSKFFNKR
jgi:hypothetical protein